jgi:hypothetical protein
MIGSVMNVFESAPAAALLGMTFASRVQTPTDAFPSSLIDSISVCQTLNLAGLPHCDSV